LIDTGIRVAVLHAEEHLARFDTTSDVDLVADRPIAEVLSAARPRWTASGLHAIVLWPYDVGGTGTIFLVNENATEGVQLDVLHDIDGRGQYGLRSGALLEHTTSGRRFPRLDEDASRIYLARKRQVKAMAIPPPDAVGDFAYHLLSPRSARQLLEADMTKQHGLSPSNARRIVSRLADPIGAWVHITSGELKTASQAATILGERMSRILPHVDWAELEPFPTRIQWWVRRVAPVRWRPGVFISWATDGQKPLGCDIVVDEVVDPHAVAERVVEALQARLLR